MISKKDKSKTKQTAKGKSSSAGVNFPDFRSGEEFDALSNAEKERVSAYYEQGLHRSEMRPLSALERAALKRERAGVKKSGDPKQTKHVVKVISLSVELGLLKRADAYAKAHGLKRAELVTQALNDLLPTG